MKKVIFIVVGFLLNIGLVYSQSSPKGISYQAVAINNQVQSVPGKNPENTYWADRDIQVRFTIYNKYPGGSAQMVENHRTKTDKFGVFNVVLGQGENKSGDLFDVEWNLGQAHLQVEIDFENNGLYKLIGIERFWSVPYALNVGNGNNSGGNADAISKKIDSIVNEFNKKIADFKTELNLQDTSKTNEIQDLEYSGNSIGLTKSNKKILLRDNEIGNELQSIKLFNDTLMISGLDTFKGGAEFSNIVALKFDKSDTNEIQELSSRNDSLFLSKSSKGIPISALVGKKNQPTNPKFVTKRGQFINGVYSASSPYGWVVKGSSIIDTFRIDSGQIIKLYIQTNSNGIQEDWELMDTSGIVDVYYISHNSYINSSTTASVSGITTVGNMSKASFVGSEWSSSFYEVIYTSNKPTILFLKYAKSWYVKSGTTNATWESNPWAYEIY
jgi:hypothetical protein